MPIRILHLEPNLADAALTLLTLKSAFPDCIIERISSLQEFEEELDESSYDVVISEYQLSDGTAEKAIKLLRRKRPLVPFIVFSEVREAAVALKMLENGAADYVFKEHRQHLASAIQEALQKVAALTQTPKTRAEPMQPTAPTASEPAGTTPTVVKGTATSTALPEQPSMTPLQESKTPDTDTALSQQDDAKLAPTESPFVEDQVASPFFDAEQEQAERADEASPFLPEEDGKSIASDQLPATDEIERTQSPESEAMASPLPATAADVEEPQAKSEQEANTAINTAPSSSLEVAERAEQVGAIDFRTIVEQLSDTILLIDRQAQIVYANPAAEKIFNGTTATLKGKNFFDFVHPDDRPLMRDRLEEIIEHPEREYTDSLELRLKLPQSPRRVISVRGCSELDNPTVQAIVLTVRDITERRQQSEKRKIQTRMLEQMMNGLALSEVMNEMCLSIENYMTDWLCSVMLVERDKLKICAAPSLPDEYVRRIDGIKIAMNNCSFGTAAHLKKRVVSENLQTDPLWEDYRNLAETFGLGACWAQPILGAKQQILGMLVLYAAEPRRPDSMEIELVESAASVASVVIERMQMQEHLRASEERLRRTIDTAPIGIFTCMLNGRFSDVNPAFCNMLGYTADELLEMTFQEITHPDDLAISTEQDEKLLSGEVQTYSLHKRYLRKNGEPVHVRVQVGLAKNADGSPAYFVAEVEDMTEVMRATKAMEESNAKLTTILDNITDGVYLFRVYPNRDFQYEFFSPSCSSIFGFTGEEMMRDKSLWMNNVHEEDRKQVIESAYAKIFEGQQVALEYRFHHKDGHLRWLSAVLSPRFDAEQNCWLVVGVTRDITERKLNELALRQSEERYRALVSSSKDGVYLIQDSKFVFANSALLNMLGYTLEELTGRLCFDIIAPEYRSKFEETFAAFGQGKQITDEYDAELLCKNGKRVAVIITIAEIFYEGKPAATGTIKDVSEKKRFEEILRQSEAELKAIFNSVPYAIVLLDRNYQVRACNQQAMQSEVGCCGKPVQIGDFILGIETPQSSKLKQSLNAALQGEFVHYETPLVADGKTRWYEVRIAPVRDTNETIIGACCISIDISDRKASEEQLQFQSRILHQMREVVIAIDTQGQIRYCNPAAESFHGKSAAEILGRRSEEVMRYRYPNKQSRQAAKQALEQEGLWQGDVIYLSHHSGKERIVLLSMAKLYTDEHKPNGLLCVLEDVTERRQAELELKKTQEQLREIIQNNPVVLFSLNALGIFSFAVGKGLELLGYDSESLVGRSVYQLFSQNTVFLQDIGRALSGERVRHNAMFDELFFEYHLSPLYDDEQKIIGVLGVAVEHTEKYRAEREREKLQAQLIQAQKMEAIGTLTGGIAHDFNNLLGAILGNLELAKMHSASLAAIQKPLERIESATMRAAALTQQLLGFARQGKFTPKQISVNQAILSALEILEHTIDKRIVIQKNLAPDLPDIYADETQLQQVFINLTLNASEAAQPHLLENGKSCITFTTALLQEPLTYSRLGLDANKTYVHIQVSDNGIGIPKEMQAKVFEPFFTTKEVGKGTGLGLSVTYGIIKNHCGVIELESEKGKGTTFHIYLPVAASVPEIKSTTLTQNA